MVLLQQSSIYIQVTHLVKTSPRVSSAVWHRACPAWTLYRKHRLQERRAAPTWARMHWRAGGRRRSLRRPELSPTQQPGEQPEWPAGRPHPQSEHLPLHDSSLVSKADHQQSCQRSGASTQHSRCFAQVRGSQRVHDLLPLLLLLLPLLE